MPPGPTGKTVRVSCFPLADYRPAYGAQAAARSTNRTRGPRAEEGGALRQVAEGTTLNSNWRCGCCRGPPWPWGLLPGEQARSISSFILQGYRLPSLVLVFLGDVLVLHWWWDLEEGGSPPWLSSLGTVILKG